jgi:hypothetical protein
MFWSDQDISPKTLEAIGKANQRVSETDAVA